MSATTNAWNGESVRERYKRELERGELAFTKMFADGQPMNPNRQVFYDLNLAELAVRRHLVGTDCFSSREALLTELKRLTIEAVPASLPPFSQELFFKCQKKEVEMEICNLA